MRYLFFLLVLLAGCAEPPKIIEETQQAVTEVVLPITLEVQDTVQSVIPPPPKPVSTYPITDRGIEHIIRWEVTSEAYYRKHLTRCVWPGGASGVTCGIGYDFGHQSTRTILRDWQGHPHAGRLASLSGITGEKAKAILPQYRDIEVSYEDALRVFRESTIPVYHASAVRAYGPALTEQNPGSVDAITGNTMNRGGSMVGSRNLEKREIKDKCLPRFDQACTAAQLRAQCRLWVNTNLEKGLCGRRYDEAVLTESY